MTPLLVGRVGRPHGLDGSFYVIDPRAAAACGRRRGRRRRRHAAHRAPLRHRRAPDPAARGLDVARGRAGAARRGADGPARRRRCSTRASTGREDLEGCAVVDGDVAVGFVRRMSALPSSRCSRSTGPTAPSCWSRWCATASARSTSRRGGSTSTWGSSVKADVFTLFPQWFDWFRTQRHVENALALGHTVEAVDFRADDAAEVGAGRRHAVRRRRGDGAARRRDGGGAARALRRRSGRAAVAAPRDRADARAAGCSTTRWRRELAAEPALTLLCGRYEGFDERILEHF